MVKNSIQASCGTSITISPEDFDLVSKFNWHITKRGYVRTQKRIDKKSIHIMLHRMITNAKPKQIVDHVNRIKTDNRRENLRVVSSLVNCLNRGPALKKSNKYKGVTKNKNGWQVYVAGKYVGFFKDQIEAAKAYDIKVAEVFGIEATTNKGMGLL